MDKERTESTIAAFIRRHKMLVGIAWLVALGAMIGLKGLPIVDAPADVLALEARHEEDVEQIINVLEEVREDVRDIKTLQCIEVKERVGVSARECLEDD